MRKTLGDKILSRPVWDADTVKTAASRFRTFLALIAMTAAGLLVHGYHLGTDDAAIYVPGIKRAADPALYPFNSEFFRGHASWSLFPRLVGGMSRLTGMPVDWAIFLWYLLCTLAVLTAGLFFLRACFEDAPAHWTGVGTLAVLLNVPVAGTALLIADPYLTARALSTSMVEQSIIRAPGLALGMISFA